MEAKQIMNRIKRELFRNYLTWEEYKDKIDFIEVFNFQQNTRQQNIKNPLIGISVKVNQGGQTNDRETM